MCFFRFLLSSQIQWNATMDNVMTNSKSRTFSVVHKRGTYHKEKQINIFIPSADQYQNPYFDLKWAPTIKINGFPQNAIEHFIASEV